MSTENTVAQTADALPPPPRPGKLKVAMREIWKSPLSAKIGMIIVLGYIFVAIFVPWLTPFGESEIVGAEFELWGTESSDGRVFVLGTP